MQRIEIEVPDALADELRQYEGQVIELLELGLKQVRIAEALRLYRRGAASFARAAELAGLTREEMIRQARAAGVEPRWSEQMAAEELA